MVKLLKGQFVSIEDLTPTVRHFRIELEEEMEYKAGQFLNLEIEPKQELQAFTFTDKPQELSTRKLLRPYSIASPPINRKIVELCVKIVEDGHFTPQLWKCEKGDSCLVRGGLGLFTLDEESEHEKIVFVAAGTGIAPFRAMISHLLDVGAAKEIVLLLGIRHENEILYKEEFEQLERVSANFRFIPVISRPTEDWEGRTGHVQHNLDVVRDPANTLVYVCGLPEMVDDVKGILFDKGMHKDQIKVEKY